MRVPTPPPPHTSKLSPHFVNVAWQRSRAIYIRKSHGVAAEARAVFTKFIESDARARSSVVWTTCGIVRGHIFAIYIGGVGRPLMLINGAACYAAYI